MNASALSFSAALTVVAGGFLSVVPLASARLGETQAQCVERYGPEVARTPSMVPGALSVSYVKSGIRIRVEFVDDRAQFISFTHARMTVLEWSALLDANRGELSWSEASDIAGRRFWIAGGMRSKDVRFASQYSIGNSGTLEIADPAWIAAVKPAIADLQAAALKGALPPPGTVAGDTALPDKKALDGF